MAKTDLKINATNGYGDNITTTISYVNPDAGKNDILAFTQGLNALTTNTYKETERIQTINVDLETVPTTPTLSASKTQYAASEFTSQYGYYRANDATILTYNGDGNLFFDKTGLDVNISFELGQDNGNWYFRPRYATNTTPTFPTSFKVGFTATDNYKAASVDITITA